MALVELVRRVYLHTLHNERGGYIRKNAYANTQSIAKANTKHIPAYLPVSNSCSTQKDYL